MSQPIYSHEATLNNGELKSLSDYQGQVILIVNTASKCGFTPQYDGLQALYEEYKDRGFTILAFPCDQFGHQEPGDDSEIQQFCSLNFNVSFPLFKKVEVNGSDASPLFKQLKNDAPGLLGSTGIKWNFTKFLVNREGKTVERFAPATKPEALKRKIEALL
jgi:glutathione peroxidase